MKAERLLEEYLESLRNANRASRDFLQAVQSGLQASVPLKAKRAEDMTDRLRDAREAFQQHNRQHHCYSPTPSGNSANSRKL